MSSSSVTPGLRPGKGSLWAGRVLTALAGLFLLMDSVMKVIKSAPAVQLTTELGYSESSIPGIGLALLISTLLYLIPQTALFGAVLVTAYLGGAVATNVRVNAPLFSHILFPVYCAILLWAGLLLREPRLRSLLPVRR